MTNGIDTLSADPALLNNLLQNEDYAYNEQLAYYDRSLLEDFFAWFDRITEDLDLSNFEITSTNFMSVLVFLAIVIIVCTWLWRNHYRLIVESDKAKLQVQGVISEDSIYGIDFDNDIRKAMSAECYAEVVRLVYLRTLRRLHDAKHIVWRSGQTPDTYIQMLETDDERNKLRRLTRVYLQVRFGHYEATQQMAENLLQTEGYEP